MALSSQKGNFAGTLYRTRKTSYKKYKNKVYRSLEFKESNRSVRTLAGTVTTSVLTASQKEWYSYTLPDNFYQAAAGYTGTLTFDTSKFIIKGGMLYTVIRNTGAVPMEVEAMLVKVDQTVTLSGVVMPSAGDVSIIPGFGSLFKLASKVRKHILEPGDQCKVAYRIPFTIINDISTWNSERGKLVILWSATASTAGALSYFNEIGHNLTFVADAI